MNILTIGSALVDIFIHSHAFMMNDDASGEFRVNAYGGKLEVENMFVRTGGGGMNTAVGFARLGFDVAAVGEIGRDELAELVLSELAKERVNTQSIIRERKEQTGGAVILVCDNGQRTVLVHRGAAAQLNPHDLPLDKMAIADWIHVASISGQLDTLKHLGQVVRQHGVKISWNPGMREIELCLAGQLHPQEMNVQRVFVNEQEWQSLQPLQSEWLRIIPEVIITGGSKGGWLYTHEGPEQRFVASPVRAIDTTGAGDAFAVGYVSARLHNKPFATATQWGVQNAASVVQRVGAMPGLLSWKELEKIK